MAMPHTQSSAHARGGQPDLSVVIPSFNSAEWLPTTLHAIDVAAAATAWTVEVVVVDDGSTDATAEVLAQTQLAACTVTVVSQQNAGVYESVRNGCSAAAATWVLILNSRLLLEPDSLSYLEQVGALTGSSPWNGHVVTDPSAPLVGRFWEVPTGIFWGSYLADPRPMDITSENFDHVPKGSGCLVIERELMLAAYDACATDEDTRFASDDTRLLRWVVAQSPIRLDPGFPGLYPPRTPGENLLPQAPDPRLLFVDSYAGTSRLRDVVLVGLVVAPPVVVLAFVLALVLGAPGLAAVLAGATVLALILPAGIALMRRVPGRAVLSYLAFVVPFGVTFWRGLAQGLRVHRAAFGRHGMDESRPMRTPLPGDVR